MADGAAEASLDSDGKSQLPRQPGGLCISAPRPRRAPRLLSGEKKQRLGIQKRSPERIIPNLRELADRCSRLASDAHWPAMHRWTGRLSSLPNFMHRCQRYRRLERPRFPPARSAKLANGTHPSDHLLTLPEPHPQCSPRLQPIPTRTFFQPARMRRHATYQSITLLFLLRN